MLSKPSSIARAPRKFINHVKRLSRHSAKQPSTSLAAVNEDCLLHIVKYLDPRDIFSLKQTCQNLRDLCNLHSAWLNAASRFIADSTLVLPPESHSALRAYDVPIEDLQRAILRADRLQRVLWASETKPTLKPLRETLLRLPPERTHFTGTFKNHPSYQPYHLTGDFKLLDGDYGVGKGPVALVVTGDAIFLWDSGREFEKGWMDGIELRPHDYVAVMAVEHAKREVVRFACCILGKDGTPHLLLSEIHFKAPGVGSFSTINSIQLPVALSHMSISGGVVMGVASSSPPGTATGNVFLYDWVTGARCSFTTTSGRSPWGLIRMADDFILCSSVHNYQTALQTYILQLIPGNLILPQLAAMAPPFPPIFISSSSGSASFRSAAPSSFFFPRAFPLPQAGPRHPSQVDPALSTGFDDNPSTNYEYYFTSPDPQTASDLKYIPISQTVSLALLEKQPLNLDDEGEEVEAVRICTYQLQVNVRMPPEVSKSPSGDLSSPRQLSESPVASSSTSATSRQSSITDSTTTSVKRVRTGPAFELLDCARGPYLRFNQGCLLASGHSMWTEADRRGRSFRLKFSISPLLGRAMIRNEGNYPDAVEARQRRKLVHRNQPPAQNVHASGQAEDEEHVTRALRWPLKMEQHAIIGMDVDERTGRVLVGLTNGTVWILDYLM